MLQLPANPVAWSTRTSLAELHTERPSPIPRAGAFCCVRASHVPPQVIAEDFPGHVRALTAHLRSRTPTGSLRCACPARKSNPGSCGPPQVGRLLCRLSYGTVFTLAGVPSLENRVACDAQLSGRFVPQPVHVHVLADDRVVGVAVGAVERVR